MRRVMNAAWKQVVVIVQGSFFDPFTYGFTCRWSDLKLHWLGSFLLHDDGPHGNMVPMTNVSDTQTHQVTGSQFAVQP